MQAIYGFFIAFSPNTDCLCPPAPGTAWTFPFPESRLVVGAFVFKELAFLCFFFNFFFLYHVLFVLYEVVVGLVTQKKYRKPSRPLPVCLRGRYEQKKQVMTELRTKLF